MIPTNQHKVAAAIRQYAEKIASTKSAANEGPPDRMTTADGQGGITTSKATIPSDVGENELKRNQPTDGTTRTAATVPAGGPDRLTTADGQGGITTAKATIPSDPGEGELKRDQPADGETLKAAGLTRSAARIRAALINANPALAKKFGTPAAAPAAPSSTEKKAGESPESTIQLSNETLCKIARQILATEEGVRFTQDMLEKQAGEDAARVQIQEAISAAQIHDAAEMAKQAAFDDVNNKAHVIYGQLISSGITEADADSVLKQASLHQQAIDALDHPLLKAAYAQGMEDAELMAAADEEGAEGAEGAAEGGEEAAAPVDGALPMSGESLSEEEIMQLLQEMIASGQITEEDIVQALSATAGGAPPAEGEPAPADPAAAAPVM